MVDAFLYAMGLGKLYPFQKDFIRGRLRGRIIMTSTPKFEDSFFWKLWKERGEK